MILDCIALYLLIGMGCLILFDLITKGRLRKNFKDSAIDAQSRMADSGNYIGNKWASVLFFGSVWLLWPFVLIGAATKKRNNG